MTTAEDNSDAPAKDDEWTLPDIKDDGPKWSELSTSQKVIRIVENSAKCLGLLLLLYAFVCAISLLSDAFRLIGGVKAGQIFQNSAVLGNPVAGLMIGILSTVLVQSSSTSTSIVVTMVSAQLLSVRQAVYIAMGGNIGTSVTTTLVSFFHSAQRDEFRRAFAAAAVHGVFNWLSVIILLPLEVITAQFDLPGGGGLMVYLSHLSVNGLTVSSNSSKGPDFLKTLTKPLTKRLVQLDSGALDTLVASPGSINASNFSLARRPGKPPYLLEGLASDTTMGIVLLVGALVVLCLCLVLIVKLLRSMLGGKVAQMIRKTVNSDLPGPAKHLTGYVAIVIGAILTFLVQSSSIFTSTLTPLVAVGVLSLERTLVTTSLLGQSEGRRR